MSRVLLRLMLLGVLGSAAAPPRVSAQPAPASTPVDKKAVARQYTDAALGAAKIGDYDTAIGFYQKAYQLVPHPTLIFDIAEAHRPAGHHANTIAYAGAIGGTVLVAAGAALYWRGYTQGRSTERVSVAPVVSDRLAGLAIAGTWR